MAKTQKKRRVSFAFLALLLIVLVLAQGVIAQDCPPETPDVTEQAGPATQEPDAGTQEPNVETPEPDSGTQEPDAATEEWTPESTPESTLEPTLEVTPESTLETTPEATLEPTTEVTAEPTWEVTSEPTVEPTVEPTAEPTLEVTVEPTAEETPASSPTPSPAATQAPQSNPEQVATPTATPTSEAVVVLPTAVPTTEVVVETPQPNICQDVVLSTRQEQDGTLSIVSILHWELDNTWINPGSQPSKARDGSYAAIVNDDLYVSAIWPDAEMRFVTSDGEVTIDSDPSAYSSSLIAFKRDGVLTLWNGSNLQTITTSEGYEIYPFMDATVVWNSDGSQFLFVDRSHQLSVYTLGALEPIAVVESFQQKIKGIDWADDGTIAVQVGPDIHVFRLGEDDHKIITNAKSPAFSRNSQYLAFVSAFSGGEQIAVQAMSWDEGEFAIYTSDEAAAHDPTWWCDQKIVFSSDLDIEATDDSALDREIFSVELGQNTITVKNGNWKYWDLATGLESNFETKSREAFRSYNTYLPNAQHFGAVNNGNQDIDPNQDRWQ